MAITRRARGSRSRAVLAAGLLAVVAIAAIPARSAVPVAPALISTSVGATGGWSDGKLVLARFDQEIRATGTTASVTESDGTPVAGNVGTAPAEFNLRHDVIVWTPNLTGRVDEFGVPLRSLPEGDYRVTFTAVSQASTLSTTVGPVDFRVDPAVPSVPELLSPVDLDIVSGDLEISGVVSDSKGKNNGAYKSGINRVMLYFYNATPLPSNYVIFNAPTGAPAPLDTIPTAQPKEVTSLRRGATLTACTTSIAGCSGIDDFGNEVVVQDFSFAATISGLTPGLWSVKVRAFDRAGNVSNEVSATFVKIA